LRVVEFGSGIAIDYAGKLFTDAGADVIKFEPPGGDPLRRWRVLPDGSEGALFRFLCHGKRSVTTSGNFDNLIAAADIVFTDDVEIAAQARRLSDSIVATVISPFGSTGPYAGRPAADLTIQAESGSLASRHHPDWPPCMIGGRTGAWVTGAYAAVASAAACRKARAGGAGELIDVSAAEVMNIAGTVYMDLTDRLRGRPSTAGPIRIPETPEVHPTADGWVGFTTNSRQQFDDLLSMIDRADLLGDEVLATAAGRRSRFDEWTAILETWTKSRTTAEIVDLAAAYRIPSSAVNDAAGCLSNAHFKERQVFVSDPTGSFVMPRRPYRLGGAAAPAPRPCPAAGADSGKVEWSARERTPVTREKAPRLPLQGIRIIDMTTWWAGPSGTGILAALGAEVIHVEAIQRIDGARAVGGAISGPGADWWEFSPQFLAPNANKLGITLDLSREGGRDLLLKLLGEADGVFENFSRRVLPNLGLDEEYLRSLHPHLIVVRMPGFGLDGPLRDAVGFAQTMEQMTGLAWLTGHTADRPHNQRGPCDPSAGCHAAFAFLVALAERDHEGRGMLVEAPMVESALNVAAESLLAWTANGEILARQGNRCPWAAPQNVYQSRDEETWLAVSVETDEQWASLVRALDAPVWATSSELVTAEGRQVNHARIDEALSAWAGEHTAADAALRLISFGVPAAELADPRRSSEHPQFADRSFFESVDHPVAGKHPMPGMPFRFASVDGWIRSPAPTLGRDNNSVLSSLIGLSAEEIEALERESIIGTRPAGL
jgi:crotonobetainyl-CoA:carnitine CoA-transferase CaiB-like acyl-CoA transferase